MENHWSPVSPGAAREHLRAARGAQEASVRRARTPTALILAVGFFCGSLTLAPGHTAPGQVVTIIAVLWLVAELVRLSARNHWRALRSLPRPKWNALELALMCLAVVVGGVVGPHLVASRSNTALASYALAAVVMVTVDALLLAANDSYRRRNSRAWRP